MLDDGAVLVASAGGGQLAWLRHGESGTLPVIGLHGTPGGRGTGVPGDDVLAGLSVDYVTFDRPGYGDSTRRAGRTVASVAADVLRVADAAGFASFSVVGGSGGSAHALAVAAQAPGRVRAVTLVVPAAPRVGEPSMGDAAWFAGMDSAMAGLHRLGAGDEAGLRMALAAVMEDQADVDGIVDDLLSSHRDWGFDLARVECPVAILFGVDDVNAPRAQALWLAGHLADAKLYPQSGGHDWPRSRMREIFTATAEAARR